MLGEKSSGVAGGDVLSPPRPLTFVYMERSTAGELCCRLCTFGGGTSGGASVVRGEGNMLMAFSKSKDVPEGVPPPPPPPPPPPCVGVAARADRGTAVTAQRSGDGAPTLFAAMCVSSKKGETSGRPSSSKEPSWRMLSAESGPLPAAAFAGRFGGGIELFMASSMFTLSCRLRFLLPLLPDPSPSLSSPFPPRAPRLRLPSRRRSFFSSASFFLRCGSVRQLRPPVASSFWRSFSRNSGLPLARCTATRRDGESSGLMPASASLFRSFSCFIVAFAALAASLASSLDASGAVAFGVFAPSDTADSLSVKPASPDVVSSPPGCALPPFAWAAPRCPCGPCRCRCCCSAICGPCSSSTSRAASMAAVKYRCSSARFAALRERPFFGLPPPSPASPSAAPAAPARPGRPSLTSRFRRRTLRRMKLYQWFFTWLSVRPGRRFAISLHLLPSALCASTMICSSSAVHGPLLIVGSRWLCQRSRHCLPVGGRGRRIGVSRRWGLEGWPRQAHVPVRPLMLKSVTMCSAITLQLLVPCVCTSSRIAWSSSFVHTRRFSFLPSFLPLPGFGMTIGSVVVSTRRVPSSSTLILAPGCGSPRAPSNGAGSLPRLARSSPRKGAARAQGRARRSRESR